MSNAQSTSSVDFVVEDCFADDDLLTPDEDANAVKQQQNQARKSFLERDDFASEFGTNTEDPFGEDFSDIAAHEIIDVFGEGDLVARPVVVLYAYRFPSNKTFDHLKFLRFIQATLDKLVDLDYTIIYFHYGLRSNNKPPLKWLIRAYQLLDRRYKKNLQALYVVHPTKFVRFIWRIFQPFISLKFEQKMHYINTLDQLHVVMSTTQLNLPQPIIDFDNSVAATSNNRINPQQNVNAIIPPRPTQQFDVPLKFILDHNPNSDIPPIAAELIDFLMKYGLETKGIFRRSAPVTAIKMLQQQINMGERIDFVNHPVFQGDIQNSVIYAAVLFKTFLRSLKEPLITNGLYPELTLLDGIEKAKRTDATRELVQRLPPENYLLLKRTAQFLVEVSKHSEENLMTISNLSVVFGPNLTWPTDQQVPISQLNNLNNFCFTLIKNFDEIFIDNL